MHRRRFLRAVFRYPAGRLRSLAGTSVITDRPGGAHGVPPFAVFLPPASVGASPRRDLPTYRFPSARGPVVFTGSRLSRATVMPRSFTHVAVSHLSRATGRLRPPRLLGFLLAGEPYHAVRFFPSSNRRRGRDCPGLLVLSQVFGYRSTRHTVTRAV
jgi:hypothetical protein